MSALLFLIAVCGTYYMNRGMQNNHARCRARRIAKARMAKGLQ